MENLSKQIIDYIKGENIDTDIVSEAIDELIYTFGINKCTIKILNKTPETVVNITSYDVEIEDELENYYHSQQIFKDNKCFENFEEADWGEEIFGSMRMELLSVFNEIRKGTQRKIQIIWGDLLINHNFPELPIGIAEKKEIIRDFIDGRKLPEKIISSVLKDLILNYEHIFNKKL